MKNNEKMEQKEEFWHSSTAGIGSYWIICIYIINTN